MAQEIFRKFEIKPYDLCLKAGDPIETGVSFYLPIEGSKQAIIVQLGLKSTHNRAEAKRLEGVAYKIAELLHEHIRSVMVHRGKRRGDLPS